VTRLVVVAVLLALFVVARRLYMQRRARLEADQGDVPDLPKRLRSGAPRTWVVFTTPTCASCGPVTDELRRRDPDAAILTLDATREPELADVYRVRTAPTVFLADDRGRVSRRFVGATAALDQGVNRP